MPSNLYERRNEFRLIDVDGVLLDTPLDYLIINEPDGFSQFNITIERDSDVHGLFYEFGGEDELLGFDRVKPSGQLYSPFTMLTAIIGSTGIDSKVQFEFLNWDGAVWVSQYKADLDFESLRMEDYKISVNSRRILLGDLFRTRADTPVDFGKTESIDGDTITGISPVSMFLHGKVINKKSRLSAYNYSSIDNVVDVFDEKYILLTLTSEYNDIIFDESSSPVSGRLSEKDDFNVGVSYLGASYLLNTPESKYYDVNINVSFSGSVVKSDNVLSPIECVLFSGDFPWPDGGDNDTSVNVPIDRVSNGTGFDFSADYSFIKRMTSETEQKELVLGFDVFPTNVDNINVDFIKFDIEIQTVFEGSTANVYTVFDSTNHIIESITNKTNVLESSFLSNEAGVIYQTNGYNIRKFNEVDTEVNPNVKTSFKEQFNEFLQKNFGLGYSIYDNSGEFKLLIERYNHFYQDVEIDYIDTIQDGTYFIDYDKDLIFNEFKIGYKDYPKSTDENKDNNLDEYNTDHTKLSPIQSVKKKADYVSSAISSGYKIENQRREQFKNKPSDTVSDDSKVFVIDGKTSNKYNYQGDIAYVGGENDRIIFLNATYLDIQVGEEIKVTPSDTGGFEGVYNVKDVEVAGVDLIVYVNEDVDSGGDLNQNITVTISEERLRADRGEDTFFFRNVVSPETSYNVGLNPVWMLKNHSLLFNSGFKSKSGDNTIKTSDIKLNSSMEVYSNFPRYDYNLDNGPAYMSNDIELDDMNNFERLFSSFLIKFTASITYQRVLEIRNNYLNQGSNNFGFLRIKDPFGSDQIGFLMSMTYNPMSEQADFVLRQKFVPKGGEFDYVLDFDIN